MKGCKTTPTAVTQDNSLQAGSMAVCFMGVLVSVIIMVMESEGVRIMCYRCGGNVTLEENDLSNRSIVFFFFSDR